MNKLCVFFAFGVFVYGVLGQQIEFNNDESDLNDRYGYYNPISASVNQPVEQESNLRQNFNPTNIIQGQNGFNNLNWPPSSINGPLPELPGGPSFGQLGPPNIGSGSSVPGAGLGSINNNWPGTNVPGNWFGQFPGAPSLSGTPSIPGASSFPGAPSLPGASSIPGAPSLPGVPSIPGAPSLPGTSLPGTGFPGFNQINNIQNVIKPGQKISETIPSSIVQSVPATQSPAVAECIRTCPVTPEYNPVCGTDNVTYENPGRLSCAQFCGVNVRVLKPSRCVLISE